MSLLSSLLCSVPLHITRKLQKSLTLRLPFTSISDAKLQSCCLNSWDKDYLFSFVPSFDSISSFNHMVSPILYQRNRHDSRCIYICLSTHLLTARKHNVHHSSSYVAIPQKKSPLCPSHLLPILQHTKLH